ncbi:MAG: FAD:protein FMN transferase [Methylococcales bacterium]
MGTTFSIKIPKLPQGLDPSELKKEINDTLIFVNSMMSTYQADSELSKLNQNPSTGWIGISAQLAEVLDEALRISELSDGAYDVTVGPLVNLWGFGPGDFKQEVPNPAAIKALLTECGFRMIRLNEQKNAVRKNLPDIYIDLSSIAKGYGVDQLADLLSGYVIRDYLIEVGGELRVRGSSAGGKNWTIGIEKPVPGERLIEQAIQLKDVSVATSGDYRNFFEVEGVRYSHMIDPRTGWPVSHDLASVTVLDKTAMRADGLATALMVLGSDAGFRLAQEHHIVAFFIKRDGAGFAKLASSKFPVESK